MSWSNSALVSATAVFSMVSRLTASWYSRLTRWPMLVFRSVELALQLGDLGEGLLVLGVVGAVLGFDDGELLAGLIDAVGEPAELLALGGGLGGFERTALHGVEGGLLADAIGLGVGELGVELEQARGEDAGLLLRVDDAQVLFELRQGGGGALHLGLELFHLLFHEGGEAGGGAESGCCRCAG